MDIEALIAKRLAAPKSFRVTTTYADGKTKTHDTETIGQAENYARGQLHKINRDLIDRDTGNTVRVIDVAISDI